MRSLQQAKRTSGTSILDGICLVRVDHRDYWGRFLDSRNMDLFNLVFERRRRSNNNSHKTKKRKGAHGYMK